ncbi:hypothetical protein AaE_004454 [Aphanomyces astaci]|uniref:CREG-like beta-barrel domain-containing protein n=1 Tax=Aphanomyces astaci TaxID=112090 RepID=A0A6A5AJ16_APHAT|nr:hypothetical protein AaE_004454 [Aphanomyces astaci]
MSANHKPPLSSCECAHSHTQSNCIMTESTPVFQTHATADVKSRKWLVAGAALASTLVVLGVSQITASSSKQVNLVNLRAESAQLGSLSGLTAEESAIATALNPQTQRCVHLYPVIYTETGVFLHKNTWATIATTSIHLNGAPYAGLASYSDGVGTSAKNATGKLYFYLTPMDSTGQDVTKSPSVSVGISMAQLGQCKMDPQDPTCWKATFSGKLLPVEGDEVKAALEVLYSKHPQMSWWPADHGFRPYELHPTEILLLDFYGGAKSIAAEEYYAVEF